MYNNDKTITSLGNYMSMICIWNDMIMRCSQNDMICEWIGYDVRMIWYMFWYDICDKLIFMILWDPTLIGEENETPFIRCWNFFLADAF